MKSISVLIIAIFISITTSAQDKASVETSIYGIQTGVLGIWAHNEYKLNDAIALRTEVGFDTGIFGGYYQDNTNFVLFPTISLEPRYYYNLNRRLEKGKSITNNSGNFFTIRLQYIPDWFVISNVDNISVAENFAIIPKWAIKRTVGKHFTYETGIGIGYRQYFLKQYGYLKNESEAALDLHLRIGYTF